MKEPTKEQLFDYVCRVNEKSQNETVPDSDFLFIAHDGATCWGKTYAEAVMNAYRHDYELGNDKVMLQNEKLVLHNGLTYSEEDLAVLKASFPTFSEDSLLRIASALKLYDSEPPWNAKKGLGHV